MKPRSIWVEAEAQRIVAAYPEKKEITLATGYGPSGPPHIGTFSEVARTFFVAKAIQQLKPTLQTRLIVFSDDLDGFRTVPKNMPEAEKLNASLGLPLSQVFDPFGKASSYAEHMNNQLKSMLQAFGFEYEFHSATADYQSGRFDPLLKKVLENYEQIKTIFVANIGAEKRAAWSPILLICPNCGKLNSTKIQNYNVATAEVEYHCCLENPAFKACGHQGVASILSGRAKLGWKVDWAMRWIGLGIDYEMHGKDLLDSVSVSRQVAAVLGKKAPLTYKYELFLDENGAKISKKIGNGITMDQWQKYSPLAGLLYFLLQNPNKPQKMGLSILPKLVDDYLQSVSQQPDLGFPNPFWFLNQLKDVQPLTRASSVTYNLLVNVAASIGIEQTGLLYDYASRYDSEIQSDSAFYQKMCAHVLAYAQQVLPTTEADWPNLEPSMALQLPNLINYIEQQTDLKDADRMQTFLFSMAKAEGFVLRDWFQFLYQVLLKQPAGPKLGPFFVMLGKIKTLDLLNQAWQACQQNLKLS